MNRDFVWWGRGGGGLGLREFVKPSNQPLLLDIPIGGVLHKFVLVLFVCNDPFWLVHPKKKKTLILCRLSKMEVSIGWWSAFPLAHHSIMGTQFKERGNGYYGEGLCYQLQNSMEIWSMHTKWAPQNVMSQSIVQGTFEHFLKGDEHELWLCSMNCCTIYCKFFWVTTCVGQFFLPFSPPPFFFVCPFSFITKGARSLWIYFSCHIHFVIKYRSRFWKLFRLCLLSICLFKQIEVAQVTNFPKTFSLYQISYA